MTTIFSGETVSEIDKQIFTASFTQEGLWLLDQLQPGSTLNTLLATIEVSSSLSPQVLKCSLEQLAQHHDTLRTTFAMRDGQLVQVIAAHLDVPLSIHNLWRLPEAEQQAQIQHLAGELAQQPFALEQGPLLRCTLLQLSEQQSLLLLTLHRAICDLSSLPALVRELAFLYDAISQEQPSPLPPLPVQYAQFALQQREELAAGRFAASLAYWQRQLADPPVALELPTDYPRPASPSWRGASYQATLPASLALALRELSHQQQVSLEELLIAAWATLLARYSGQQDLLLGTISTGQGRTHTEALIGPYENLQPLRLDLSDSLSFVELLGRVRQVREEATRSELPFELLLKELHPDRTLLHQPLCQVLLRLDEFHSILPSGWQLIQVEEGPGSSQFDLSLDIQQGEAQELFMRFTYRADLFEPASIVRLAGHWQTLLEGIVADPGSPVTHLPLLTQAERHQLLSEWTSTQRDYPQSGLAQLFEAQVARRPEAVAVLYEHEQLNYQELNRQANQLAHYLREQGVGPETLVAILAERGIPFLLAMLAIFKAGGAYLPLDPHHPQARVRRVLEQSRSRFVLCTRDFQATLSGALEGFSGDETPHSLIFEDLPLAEQSEENLPPCSSPRALAYVIYTSGSTGQPKGAMVEQRGMLNHLYAKIEALNLSEQDIVAQTASQCFDISVWQFLAALLVGGQVRIYPDAVAHDALELLRQVEAQRVSILETVPSLLTAMLDAYENEQESDRPALHALRWLIPTGEALPVELCRRWLARYPRVPLLNAYGPTECSDDVTHYVISEPPAAACRSIPIGTAIPNLRLYVLDAYMQPVPIGVSGELYVGGIGVGRGYLEDEQRTKAAFVPDPFTGEEGARLYKTGDRARYLPDGNLEFLGRLDHQVKLRGYRIELGEIEAILSPHPAVRQAVVLVREDVPGEPRLVAYVVLHQQPSVTLEELKRQLAQQVPAYMVPSAWISLEQLPLTSNGKLDRKALPVPERSRNEREESYVAPVSPLQRQLVTIWEELLDVRPIGIRDDFFELGGDSLLAVRLFERMAQVSGKRLSLATLFAGATIEHVASVLQEGEPSLPPSETSTRAPLVVVQSGGARRPFFFLHGQWRGGALYSRELARRMGPEQPFYLLEPYKIDGLAVPPTLEEMAAAHLEAMRKVQPQGPYRLGGWCNGGLIAYEMARQLHAQGQTVELLVLMDSDAPAPKFKEDRRIIDGLCSLLRLSKEKQVDWFLLYRHLRLSFHHWRKHTSATQHDELEPGMADEESPELEAILPGSQALRQDWIAIYDWAAAGYMPHPYPGKVTFFWTEEEPRRRDGWHKLIEAKIIDYKKVDAHIIPGNHITSRTRYLPVLAEHLSTCLSKVDE